MYNLAIIGAGAAGFFAAITFKKNNPLSRVVIIEKSSALLSKVKLSGGGRCNITNGTYDIKALVKNYPRGSKELLGPFSRFQPRDMIEWFKIRNIDLKKEKNGKIFPKSDTSQTIVDCFINEAKSLKIEILLNQDIQAISKKDNGFEIELNKKQLITKNLLLATGSNIAGYDIAKLFGHTIQEPIPSLFSFSISNFSLKHLSGISVSSAQIELVNSSLSTIGPLLITHEGFSGPAILDLSSWSAKYLKDNNYKAEISINWLGNVSLEEAFKRLNALQNRSFSKTLIQENIFNLPNNLWNNFVKSFGNVLDKKVNHISKKDLRVFSKKLTQDIYKIIDKSNNKSEFVTCGGITLKEVNFKTMQSKICDNLFFAGEILDIDGITGGFNFQNAWTTAYVAATNIGV